MDTRSQLHGKCSGPLLPDPRALFKSGNLLVEVYDSIVPILQ